jgi:hypothetical protein
MENTLIKNETRNYEPAAAEDVKLNYVRGHIGESLRDMKEGGVWDGDDFFKNLMAGKYD